MTNATSLNGQPNSWRWRPHLILAVLADAVLAGVLVTAGAGTMLRAFAVFLFLVLGPGLAVTGFLRLHDPATELALAIPLSLAVDVGVAAGMSMATAWRPNVALVGSVIIAGAALALQLYRDRPVVDRQGQNPLTRTYQRWLGRRRGGASNEIASGDDDRSGRE
jgi:hypothetical protein